MTFKVVKNFTYPFKYETGTAYLTFNNWNDYSFQTLYSLIFVDEFKNIHEIGTVKIGFFGQSESDRSLSVGDKFDTLDSSYFSLGQSDSYYVNLNKLGESARDTILKGLNDIAKNRELFDKAIAENVTKVSLLRYVSPATVVGQFNRIAFGGIRLTGYKFKYKAPKLNELSSNCTLDFQVEPESYPPTNIHVLIGKNGVGKTYLTNNMINSLLSGDQSNSFDGLFEIQTSSEDDGSFANMISISFSAFDDTIPRPEQKDNSMGLQYSYIGLKQVPTSDNNNLEPKSTILLNYEFIESLDNCRQNAKKDRWKMGIDLLESDPNFLESEIKSLIDIENDYEFKECAFNTFRTLSSGHKVILLIITQLIERLQERTLVLIDEPEAHLHPPLLSAFIRALSELLIESNGVAIIATHSPVILQEVPKKCVWKLRRTGLELIAERPSIETFGENVGVLTNEVFGLEVTNSGFFKLLFKVAQAHDSYNEVLRYFEGQLGNEAKAILRSYYANIINEL